MCSSVENEGNESNIRFINIVSEVIISIGDKNRIEFFELAITN